MYCGRHQKKSEYQHLLPLHTDPATLPLFQPGGRYARQSGKRTRLLQRLREQRQAAQGMPAFGPDGPAEILDDGSDGQEDWYEPQFQSASNTMQPSHAASHVHGSLQHRVRQQGRPSSLQQQADAMRGVDVRWADNHLEDNIDQPEPVEGPQLPSHHSDGMQDSSHSQDDELPVAQPHSQLLQSPPIDTRGLLLHTHTREDGRRKTAEEHDAVTSPVRPSTGGQSRSSVPAPRRSTAVLLPPRRRKGFRPPSTATQRPGIPLFLFMALPSFLFIALF